MVVRWRCDMNFTANKYLPVALALAAFAFATNNAHAQGASSVSQTYTGTLNGFGGPVDSVQQFAHAPSTNNSGKNAFAQAPATIVGLVPDYSGSDRAWSTTGRGSIGR